VNVTVTSTDIASFYEIVMDYYHDHARSDLPWRLPEQDGSYDPYKILVSELMLQQTQVARVIPKYTAFITLFPNVESLANASLAEVLRAWQGLGYNRRAKYVWMAAKQIAHDGWPDDLTELPGVGGNTSGAVAAYAFNQPTVFIETNIRTVFIYHFARDERDVPDSFIRGLLSQVIEYLVEGVDGDVHDPRNFYWALMDYGTDLKTKIRNLSQSKQYKRQSTFKGSKRQLRGLVIRALTVHPCSLEELQNTANDERLERVLVDLEREGLITKTITRYELSR